MSVKVLKTTPFMATMMLCAAAAMPSFGAKPYDAEIEYLDSNATSGKTAYIDTGLIYTNNIGSYVRFSPKQMDSDNVLFGVGSRNDRSMYFGGPSSGGFYFGWNGANTSTRPMLTAQKTYDVYYNWLNGRQRWVVGVDDATLTVNSVTTNEFYAPDLTATWNSGGASVPIHLFGQCRMTGVHTDNGSWYRIYSAQFTTNDVVMMDLIPVRKDGVGCMYDKVSGTILPQMKASDAVPNFALGNDVANESYIAGTVILTQNEDWTSRGMLRMESDAVIDLNGYSLTIVGAYGTGTITNNSSVTQGELHFNVPAVGNVRPTLAITGNIKVFKEGEGSLALIRSGQTFTGGVVVAGGTAYAPYGADKNAYNEANCYWGPKKNTITVMPGATFDNNGNTGYGNKEFILAGGTLANSGYVMNTFSDGYCRIKLTADSYINAAQTTHILEQSAAPAPDVDLGGHTLYATIGSGKILYVNTVISNGTIDVVSGGQLRPSTKSGGSYKHGSNTLDLRTTGGELYIGDNMIVRDYYAGYTGTSNGGTSKLAVYGTFTPAAMDAQGKEYFYGCTMQDGSCIDLSAKSSTWDTTSTGFTAGSRTVSFVSGTTVAIDIHGRTPAKGEQIVSWSSRPSNVTFTWDAATAALGKQIFVTDEGIYYDIAESDVATAHWTGAVGDNDTANPLNWACTNYLNAPVSGVPMGSTDVYISGDIAIQMTNDSLFAYNSIYFNNARLTADCDWSEMKAWTTPVATASITDIGSIDLNGHKLHLVASSISGKLYDDIRLAVTDGSFSAPGELHIDVPLANSDLVCNGFTLSGNVKLVKDGAGKLAMTKSGQTFVGGVLVAEGTAYSALGQKHPENENYWGAAGGTITVMTNATFDSCNNTNYLNKSFVLNGGTLATSESMGYLNEGFGNVTLVADSVVSMPNTGDAMVFCAPNGTERLDLGGHTLSVAIRTSCHIYMRLPIENGTLLFRDPDGGYLHIRAETTGGSPTVNLVMEKAAMYIDGMFSVSNYVANYTGNYNAGTGTLKVYGTFTPVALKSGKEAFFGPEMQNGSSIDLSAKTNAFNVVAMGFSGTGDMSGNRTMTFANGATVGVLLGTRKLGKEEQIIDWSAAVPGNRAGLKFYGEFADGKRINLMVRDDGVYAPKKGLMLVVR